MLKLGLNRPAKLDSRTLKLETVIRTELLPAVPDYYHLDPEGIPISAFGNDEVGNCVIAGQANWLLRSEKFQQDKYLPISTNMVKNRYWKMQGSHCLNPRPDNGLVILDNLKNWRNYGWRIDGQFYKLKAYGIVDWHNHKFVNFVGYYLFGNYVGVALPLSAQTEFFNNQPWSDTSGIGGEWGYHCIYIAPIANHIGPICLTWGKFHQITWEWWDKYVFECWACISKSESWKINPIDDVKLESYLDKIDGD